MNTSVAGLHSRRRVAVQFPLVSRWPQAPALSLVALFTVANLVWVLRDKTSPSWDQSHYLYMTWVYRHDLTSNGWYAVLHDLVTIDPGRGPMLSLIMVPIAYFTNADPSTGLILNVILWPILLLSVGGIAAHFYGERARFLAILLTAPLPLLVVLSHSVLQDFLLATLSTLFIWLLLRTRGFTRPIPSAALGIVFAVAVLTKLSFPIVVAVPMMVVLVQGLSEPWLSRRDVPLKWGLRRPVGCLALFTILGAVVPTIWYIKEWTPTEVYLHAAFAQQPGTLKDPTSIQNLGEMFLSTLNDSISWQITFITVLALIFGATQLHKLKYSISLASLGNFVFLFSWLVVPYLAVAVSDNHGDRYAVASFPAFGVIIAGLISSLPVSFRWVMTAVAVIAAFTMTMQVESAQWRLPFLASSYSLNTRFGAAEIQFSGGVGWASNIGSENYTSAVMNYLETLARLPSGGFRPLRVAILELQSSVNGNTMLYEATVRRLPFVFTTLVYTNQATLKAQLEQNDVALYLTQPPRDEQGALGRVAQLNNTSAAYGMRASDFRLFKPHPHKIFVGPDAGEGDLMSVLVRRS